MIVWFVCDICPHATLKPLALVLLVANLAITKLREKKLKYERNPGTWVLI